MGAYAAPEECDFEEEGEKASEESEELVLRVG